MNLLAFPPLKRDAVLHWLAFH